jgi:hypothetical protein
MAIKSLLTVKGALLTTAALVVVGGGIYASSNHSGKTPTMGPVSTKSTQPSTDQKSQIDYSPPTAQEKAEANAKSNAIAQTNNDKNAQSSSGKKSVTPIITNRPSGSDDPITVRGQVSGVFENGGTCTATFTQSGKQPVSATSQGIAAGTYTTCPPIIISHSQLSGGKWQITLSYSSASAEGTSSAQTLQL